jgi:pyridoxamine 5'-phosphate oxidase
MPIDIETLDANPLVELGTWIDAARAAGHRLPEAFALATADSAARPSVRMVLLRGIVANGLHFYTNRQSPKGQDLAANPRAAGTFWWEQTNRQVRLAGEVSPLADAETAAYWVGRPRGHQLAAWASAQSEPIPSRSALEARVDSMTARFGEEAPIPVPDFWGGYQLRPEAVEFWESRADRLHDRIEYRRQPNGTWERRRLQP